MTPGAGLPGWERLRHGGLLLDGARLEAVSRHGNAPAPLDAYTEGKLRQRAGAMLDGAGAGSGDGGESGGSGAGSGESGDGGEEEHGRIARGGRDEGRGQRTHGEEGEPGRRACGSRVEADGQGAWRGGDETHGEETPGRPPRARLRLVTPAADARYVRCVPLAPLAAAAGAFGDPHTVPEESDWEWVEVETARPLRRGMFVARVVGRSMEPAVPDGAWCLFASPVTGTRAGRVVLVRLDDALDPDTGQRFTVKRYRSEKTADEEGWRHVRITLSPDNPEFSPIELEAEDEGSVAVVAELVEVIGPEPPAGGSADP